MLREYAGELHGDGHAGRIVVCARSIIDIIEDVGVAGVIVSGNDTGKTLRDLVPQEKWDVVSLTRHGWNRSFLRVWR